jgi:hypothetical protein
VLGGGICECLWLGDNDVTLSMVKRAYQNFNKHTKMSSTNTKTNLSKYLLSTLGIKYMNVAGAFVSPKGTTINSYCPYYVLKAVLWISSSLILTW